MHDPCHGGLSEVSHRRVLMPEALIRAASTPDAVRRYSYVGDHQDGHRGPSGPDVSGITRLVHGSACPSPRCGRAWWQYSMNSISTVSSCRRPKDQSSALVDDGAQGRRRGSSGVTVVRMARGRTRSALQSSCLARPSRCVFQSPNQRAGSLASRPSQRLQIRAPRVSPAHCTQGRGQTP